uniref:Lysine-specific demethylase lid-like n=1 Tax=Diabrotica virgifera virgifera TaxID=50390 RepID=A0A6P7H8M3_DIAVI
GVTNAEREAFELLHDDERQCEICKTTCFLSAMTCSCSAEKLVCLRHFQNHCECSPENRTLRYRYTLEELPRMMQNLKVIAESFETWVMNVNEVLDQNLPKRTLTLCRELLHEATVKKFPKSELLQKFSGALELAEKYANGVEQLDPNKMRTRHSNDAKITLTFNQLVEFSSELEDVFCHVDETNCVRDLLHEAQVFEKDSNRLLNLPLAECSITDLEVCHALGSGLRSLELPNIKLLASRIKHCQWYQSVLSYKEKDDVYTIEWLKHFLTTGNKLDPHQECYKQMIELQAILKASEIWEDKAEKLFKCTDNDLLIQVDQLLKERVTIKCFLPNEAPLKESVDKARDWLKIFEDMKSSEYSPYFEEVDRLVKRGRSLALQLVEVDRLNVILDRAKKWKEETSNIFLKTNSTITLLEALMPREINNEIESPPKNKLLSLCKAATRFKESENRELDFIRNLKAANGLKSLDPKDNSNFCICKKKVSGVMMQCDLCKDWFHSTCVELPKVARTKFTGKFNTAALQMGFKDCKFLCLTCVRTKRPLLKELKDLLVRIDELPVIMREGAALQWLSERALQLQERAKQLLLHPELESAKNELDALIKKYTEAAESESAKKESIRQKNSRERASRKLDLTSKVQEIKEIYENIGAYSGNTDSDSSEYDSDRMGEHAYSLNLPKVDSDDYRLILSPEIKERLQEILMEADLLEVSLNEAFPLWTILQASRDSHREPIYIDFDKKKDKPKEPLIVVRKSMRPKKKRRRLSEEMDLPKKLSKTVKVEQEVDIMKKLSKNGKIEADKKQQEIDITKKVSKTVKTDPESKMRLRRLKKAKAAGKKRKGKKRGRKPKVSSTASPSTDSEDEDDDDDEEDICAANGCQKPAEEKKIDWVQCDGGCDKWFHMVCVGLSAGDIQEDEDYICITCSKHTTYETMDSSSCSPKPSTSKNIS